MAAPMAVSKENIVEASIAILNRDGYENLTMRAIAKELNIKAASLYWHFKGKEDLHGAIAEYMINKNPWPEDMDNAEDYLSAAGMAYRSMLLTVRDSPVIFENSIPNTPQRIEIIRKIGENILKLGVCPENLMTFSNMLNNYVLSFTADEIRFKNTPPEVKEKFEKILNPNDGVVFISDRDFDEQFLYGMRILLAGLKIVEAE